MSWREKCPCSLHFSISRMLLRRIWLDFAELGAAYLWVFDSRGAGAEGEEEAGRDARGAPTHRSGPHFGYRCCSRRGGRLRDIDADFGMALIYRKAKP
jgi:hypothetical protein